MNEIITRLEELGLSEELVEDLDFILRNPSSYKLLRKHQEEELYPRKEGMKRVLILDTETTGVNTEEDELIELGYVLVEFDNNANLGNIVKVFNGLNEPRLSILNSHIHGITDEDVKGCKINIEEVRADVASANLAIAHNSNFDRRIVERYIPEFKGLPWACTLKDINWNKLGISSHKLEFLAFSCDFYYEAHRAVNDVYATLKVIRELDLFKTLVAAALTTKFLLKADGAPFGSKDILKARGYKPLYRNGKFVCWYNSINAEQKEEEAAWLKSEALCKRVPIKEVTAYERYSIREDVK